MSFINQVGNALTGSTGTGAFVGANGPTFVTTTVTAPSITFSTTSGIIGTTTNDNAAAGSVGEYGSTIAAGGSVPLATVTAVNITSISLTAGDWDVWGNINITGDNTTVFTAARCSITTSSAGFAGDPYDTWGYWPGSPTPFAGFELTLMPPAQRFSLSTTTTIYLTLLPVFTVATASAGGGIFARRRR